MESENGNGNGNGSESSKRDATLLKYLAVKIKRDEQLDTNFLNQRDEGEATGNRTEEKRDDQSDNDRARDFLDGDGGHDFYL